jgi:hypothetical protein
MILIPLNWFFVAALFLMLWLGGIICIGTITAEGSPIYHADADAGLVNYSQSKTW